jgi:hypothetical protein
VFYLQKEGKKYFNFLENASILHGTQLTQNM